MKTERKKVGILTYHAAHNYGAYLQAYALCMRLREDFPSADVEIVDYDTRVSRRHYIVHILQKNACKTIYNIRRYLCFRAAQKKLPLSARQLISDKKDDIEAFIAGQYNVLVSGSDEIWKIGAKRGFPTAYWLPGSLKAAKLSYAASSRTEVSQLTEHQKQQVCDLLSDYSYIGVRDRMTQQELAKLLPEEKHIHINCDPSFVYDFPYDCKRGGDLLAAKFKVKPGKKVIAMMLVDDKLVGQIRKFLGEEYAYISLYRGSRNAQNAVLSPFEWVDVIAAVDVLITSFFHGVCFAIHTNTKHLAIEEKPHDMNLRNSKIFDLLDQLSMTEAYKQKNDDQLMEWIETSVKSYDRNTPINFQSQVRQMREQYNSFKDALGLYIEESYEQ